MTVLSFIFAHKVLLFFVVATAAFGISTIILGVENADLKTQLDEKNTIEIINKTTTPTTTTEIVTKTTTSTTSFPTTTTEPPPDMSKYRLPSTAAPISYDLYLYPDLKTGLFKGQVIAKTNIIETTSEIVMHNNKLSVSKILIDKQPGTFELDQKYELLTIKKLDGSVFLKGSVVNVTADFDGDMKSRIVGLYTSSYTNPAGQQR